MRFESIKIKNYRQYQDLSVNFNKNSENDLHIIIASNGVGKTNLLNAINWCLYGDEPHLDNPEESLSICNLQALEQAQERGDENCKVSVEIAALADGKHITIIREIPVTTATDFAGMEKLKAIIFNESGMAENLEREGTIDIINQYLPRKIREYFFFDGEQLNNYFGAKKNGTHIKDSIHEIAQVHTLTNIKKNLKNIARDEYQKNIGKMNPKIDEIAKKQSDIIKRLENGQKELNQLNESIQISKEIITKNDENIAGTGSLVEDNRQYNKAVDELKNLKAQKEQMKGLLHAFIRKYTVLLNTYSINKSTYEFIVEKSKNGILPPDIDINLLLKSVDEHKCVICHQDIDPKTKQYILSLIDKIEVSSEVSHKLIEIKNDVYSAIEQTEHYKEEKKKLMSRYKEIDNKIDSTEIEKQGLFERISTCSDIDHVEQWMEEKQYNIELLGINGKKLGVIEGQVEKAKLDLESADKDMQKALSETDKCEELRDYLRFANRAAQIIAEIEQEIMNEVSIEMEKETMKIFNQLIWKKNTYSHIELDINYKLQLFHQQTNTSCLGSCSAAERSLLALAFTIALHKVSGHESLLFIDTPVARVSDVNRENFARVLIEASKTKQIIMAFTPSEYSQEISILFDSSASSKVKLETDELMTQKEGAFANA